VIEKPPAEVVESATPAVTFFSNAGNLRLIECFLWLVWLLVVIALAFIARQIFICARRSVEDENAAAKQDGCGRAARKKCDEEINEMETFSNAAAPGMNEDISVASRHHNGDFDSYDGSDPISSSTHLHRYWWTPWVLFRSHRDADIKTRLRNLLILMGIVLFYCIICYILTVVTIVTFVKMTEDAEIFSRGVKCPNVSSTMSDSSKAANTEPSMGDAMNISRNPFSSASSQSDIEGPLYGNGRGFCDYSLALPHEDAFLRTSLGDTIHVWWIPRTGNGTLTAVLHHGAIGLMNQYEPAYTQLTSLGVNVAAYDYPFYGRSTGLPSEKALYSAAEAVLHYAGRKARIDNLDKVIHIGNSLGGPISVEMAKRYSSKAIILISAMDNSFKVVNHFLRLTGWVVNWFIKYYYDGFGKISTFDGCLFNAIALQDTIIPPERGRALWREAVAKNAACSMLVENPYCGHTCENFLFPAFVDTLKKFLKKVERLI